MPEEPNDLTRLAEFQNVLATLLLFLKERQFYNEVRFYINVHIVMLLPRVPSARQTSYQAALRLRATADYLLPDRPDYRPSLRY